MIPTLSRGVEPTKGKNGHGGPLPSFLWDGVRVSTVCFRGSGSFEIGFQRNWSSPNCFCLCGGWQSSVTELERSLVVRTGGCFGKSICF